MIKNKLMNETKFPADDGSGSQQCSFISSVPFHNESDLDELCFLSVFLLQINSLFAAINDYFFIT